MTASSRRKNPIYPPAAIKHHLTGSGVFLLHLRKDGAVERVETVTSTGPRVLDEEAIGVFRVWRSRPNSIRAARVPIEFIQSPPRKGAGKQHALLNCGDGVQATVYWDRSAG